MAKRIKIDFTKTEERSGWNTRQIPAGLYPAKVVSVQETEAQDGTAMLVYGFVPTDSKFKSRRFPYYCKLQQNQLWKLRDLLVAAGESVPKKAVQIDPNKIIGRTVAIEVEDDAYNGNVRSQVNGVYEASIVEDSDDDYEDVESDEEVDDEEYEDDDSYEDEEDDEEYDDEDDEEDDEDPEDEDLDDEDEEEIFEDDDEDYDDEDDEEEPEPEPAPKRRAPVKKAPAKAVAKKAPAKKAAPAPARRTVKRRA